MHGVNDAEPDDAFSNGGRKLTARKPKAAPPNEDSLEAFLSALVPVRPRADGPYTYADRHHDFKTVFGTEAGKRVLSQIVALGDKPVTVADLGNHDLMVWRHATRFIVCKITEWAAVPPPQQ